MSIRYSCDAAGPPWWLRVKNPLANAGDEGSIPGLGRSPRGGSSNPFQYPCLKSSMDRGAWRASIHGVTKSWTWLSMHTYGGASGNNWLREHTEREKNEETRIQITATWVDYPWPTRFSVKKYLELDLQRLFSYHICELRKSFFFFFNVDHFKNLYWICYNTASVLCFVFFTIRL